MAIETFFVSTLDTAATPTRFKSSDAALDWEAKFVVSEFLEDCGCTEIDAARLVAQFTDRLNVPLLGALDRLHQIGTDTAFVKG